MLPDAYILYENSYKLQEVTEAWRQLHNEELHNLHSFPDIIKGVKSRTTRWAEHAAQKGQMRNAYRVLVGKPEGKMLLGRLGIFVRIILIWVLNK
jgi:hypothetical protein